MEIIERISSPEIIRENKLEEFKRIQTKTIGVVIYKDTNDEEGKKLPFLSHEIILDTLKEEFKEYDVLEYVIAKEMGEKMDHFHYQCVLQFAKEIRQRKGYKRISINGENLYYLFEKGHSWKSLVAYCKKDGDYIASKKAMETAKVNHAEALLEKKTKKEQIEYIIKNNPEVILKGDLGRTLDNVDKALKYINNNNSEGYTFPEYLIERQDTDLIYKWYQNEVLKKNTTQRRKAIVLYSKERALGKTMLAKTIAGGQEEDFIICRGNFNKTQFEKPKARLLILDDMNFMNGQMEMWKALVTGERVSIREAYCNIEFNNGLPCIITTNNYKTFKYMLNSEYFMNDCYFSWVRNYLGPEGTQRLDDPQIYRDFVVEDIEREHSMEEENIGLKRKEHEVNNMEIEKKYRELKKIKLN